MTEQSSHRDRFSQSLYLGYTLYSHYFLMMALGRYLQAKWDEDACKKWIFHMPE
jgi:hypothetical protein